MPLRNWSNEGMERDGSPAAAPGGTAPVAARGTPEALVPGSMLGESGGIAGSWRCEGGWGGGGCGSGPCAG